MSCRATVVAFADVCLVSFTVQIVDADAIILLHCLEGACHVGARGSPPVLRQTAQLTADDPATLHEQDECCLSV